MEYIYKTNFFTNNHAKTLIRDFEIDQKQIILKTYDLNNIKSEKIETHQIVNEYFKIDDKISYLLVYQVHFNTKILVYKIIKFDTEDMVKLKEKFWRIQGKELVFYKTNPFGKKIDHVSIKCVIMGQEKTEFKFKSDDSTDYRKVNIKIKYPNKKSIYNITEKDLQTIERERLNNKIAEQKINIEEFEKENESRLIHTSYNFRYGKYNKYYRFDDSIALIVSFNDCHYITYIDIDKFDLVKNHYWRVIMPDNRHANHLVYLGSVIDNRVTRMHHYIYFNGDIDKIDKEMSDSTMVIDHINRNPLDNRLNNLRLVTIKENNRNQTMRASNTSGVVGVRFNEQKNRWIAKRDIYPNGRFTNPKARGLKFTTFEDAVIARKKLELINDEDFLSSTPTLELFKKYEEEGKFKELNI